MPSVEEFIRFFNKKDELPSISPVKPLRYFIESFPNEDLIANFIQLQKNYKYYRAILGDGNCFYRAIMFQYLRQAKLGHFQLLFPPADLFICDNLPFARPRGFDSESILRYIWEHYLFPLSEKSGQERERKLEEMLNSSANLDSALIGYLRALNYNYLWENRHKYEKFGGCSNDLNRIKTFGQESEGVELYTLATVLKAEVTVLMVHSQNYLQLNINYNHNFTHNFFVSYRPGHYDIPVCNYNPSNQNRYSGNRLSQTPGEPNSFGSPTLSRLFDKRKHSSTSDGGASFPQVIEVQKPSEVRRITIKNKEPSSFIAENELKTYTKPPLNMKQFRKSRVSNSRKDGFQQNSLQREEIKEERVESTESTSRIPKTSLKRQREDAMGKRKMFEASICGFMCIILISALFIM